MAKGGGGAFIASGEAYSAGIRQHHPWVTGNAQDEEIFW